MTEKLTGAARADALATLKDSGWTEVDDRDAIHKTFQFKNFVEAFGYMTKVAIRAEKLNHHPEWSNVYRTVDVVLTTHDLDGLSELDVKLARRLDKLADG